MRSKIKSGIKYIVLILILGIVGLLSYVSFALPDVGEPETLRVELTPERIERGRYLANSVSVCMDCHSKRDWNKFGGPVIEGTWGQGGDVFDEKEGFPGKFYARNITPSGLKDWSDGEILRAVSSGVSKDGRALFPIMPHPNFGKMDREDLYSLIAYVRTLKPIDHTVPDSEQDFPMNFIINTIPEKAKFGKIPDPANQVAYGAYLLNAALCNNCHTQQVEGEYVDGMTLAGGFEFQLSTGGIVRPANITPDMETGIGSWTEQKFVERFKLYTDSAYKPADIKPGDFNTLMPWLMYSTMKPDDLKAIYAYLRTVKPVKNQVVKFSGELASK